jgi:predicted O-methyltransferase YrrM
MNNDNRPSKDYAFTNDWFSVARSVWEILVPQIDPAKILEIGTYEGRATCFLIDLLSPHHKLEVHCVDTWEGGVEHKNINMVGVRERCIQNLRLATESSNNKVELVIHNGESCTMMAQLLSRGMANYFDFIYIDGSHLATDVLLDAILGFKMLKVGGVMVFDDYLWAEQSRDKKDVLSSPKIAIDSFTNVFSQKLRIINGLPLYQLFLQKLEI